MAKKKKSQTDRKDIMHAFKESHDSEMTLREREEKMGDDPVAVIVPRGIIIQYSI